MGNATKNEADWDQLDVAATGGIQILPNSPVSLTLRYMRGFKNLRNVDNAASGENQIASTVTNTRNSGVQAVLNFRLFGAKQKAVAITTPEVPAVTTMDSDSDGIADNMDKCPNTPGVAAYDGCPIPDTDKDGINDDVDKCPTVAGVAKYNGCPVPDTDNDGINDENDKCPTVPGVERYQGCPIPDSDNDGINDEEDNCPHLAGTEANHGCPAIDAAVQGKIDMMATHIGWSPSNSHTLSAASNRSLEQIASMLTADTALKVSVTAHTAKTMNATKDQELSENRAETVKDYLLGKGVKENQIDTKGYGSEQPVADNKTAAGRAKNQRVELRLHY
jgi:outer membrane protein OmpA-like peptidoglycan-associated protein